MNGLLESARAIVRDLVRKRLWPIAVLLVVALVAVPMFIASSSSSGEPAAPATVAATAPPPGPAATDPAPATGREAAGRVRDPFFDPPATHSDRTAPAAKQSAAPSGDAGAKTAAPTPDTPAHATSTAPADATATALVGAAPPTMPAGEPAVTPAAPPAALAVGGYFRVAARLDWHSLAGSTVRPLARLTPLGPRADPAALYLGVMKLGAPYAVFVLGRHATSAGEATCAAATGCRLIGMRPGDTQTVTLHTPAGRIIRRLTLHVALVERVVAATAKARTMRAIVDPQGRSAMHTMARSTAVAGALGRLGYERSSGLLHAISAAPSLEKPAR